MVVFVSRKLLILRKASRNRCLRNLVSLVLHRILLHHLHKLLRIWLLGEGTPQVLILNVLRCCRQTYSKSESNYLLAANYATNLHIYLIIATLLKINLNFNSFDKIRKLNVYLTHGVSRISQWFSTNLQLFYQKVQSSSGTHFLTLINY